MELTVESQPTADGGRDPQVIWFGHRRVEVQAVLDRWYGPGHRWWKVATSDGPYVLRRDEASGDWELVAVVRE